MKIVLCAAEAVPFVKVGGLGDVLGALPRQFAAAGHEVLLLIPGYSLIDRKKFKLNTLPGLSDVPLTLGDGRTLSFSIMEFTPSQWNGVRFLFIGNDHYFGRESIYSHKHNIPFEDEGELWTFFQLAVMETLYQLDYQPDILHVHDFHTAFLPALIRYRYAEFFRHTRTVLTLHNLLFQGVYNYQIYNLSGMPDSEFYPMSNFEYYTKTNFVKSGILYADAVNTVSQHYAEELLQNPAYSYGLWEIIKQNRAKFSGILNGADYKYWDPETDEYIEARYGPDSLPRKNLNRMDLIEKTGLKVGRNTMVMGIVARMTKQKGFQLLLDALEGIMKRDVVLVILASGDTELEKAWEMKQVYYPQRIFYQKDFDEAQGHRIQAGCDLFLMPSHFEPCGLSQMYAMKYGTPPLAFATGGLADTVIDSGPGKTGFLFYNYRVDDFLKALDDAVNQFNYAFWEIIQRNGMAMEFSWEKSATEYLSLFASIKGKDTAP